jgi:hypothetical protein
MQAVEPARCRRPLDRGLRIAEELLHLPNRDDTVLPGRKSRQFRPRP